MAPVGLKDESMEPPDPEVSENTNNSPKIHRTTAARRAKGQIQPRQQYEAECFLLTSIQEADQLSSNKQPPVSQPVSQPVSSSSVRRSVISSSDWQRIDIMLRNAINEVIGDEGLRAIKQVHQLQAELLTLKAENLSLQEVIKQNRIKQRPKKALFQELRCDNGNGAILFSPTKTAATRELQAQKLREQEALGIQKPQRKLAQQRRKDKEEANTQANAARQQRLEEAAQRKTEKLATRQEAIAQRRATKQLINDQKSVKKDQNKQPEKSHKQQAEEPVATGPVLATTRRGRAIKLPQHLQDYRI